MAYFIPSSIQKRLLRYALSRLELLDTDALDLERLEIGWGKRSTVDLKDVSLRKDKLAALLDLPEQLSIETAKIGQLRVTVPADLHTSSIVVEISKVDTRIRLNEEDGVAGTRTPRSGKRQAGTRPRSASHRRRAEAKRSGRTGTDALPDTEDLAKSFLAGESQAEKAQLEAALNSQSVDLRASVSSNGTVSSDDSIPGVGVGFGLPAFLASFLKGVGDRLQVVIKDVTVNLDVMLDPPVEDPLRSSEPRLTTVSLIIDDLDIREATSSVIEQTGTPIKGPAVAPTSLAETSRGSRRRINLRGVSGYLITDAAVFDQLSQILDQSVHTPSPVATRNLGQSSASSSTIHTLKASINSIGDIVPENNISPKGLESQLWNSSLSESHASHTSASDDGFMSSLPGTVRPSWEVASNDDLAASSYSSDGDAPQASFADVNDRPPSLRDSLTRFREERAYAHSDTTPVERTRRKLYSPPRSPSRPSIPESRRRTPTRVLPNNFRPQDIRNVESPSSSPETTYQSSSQTVSPIDTPLNEDLAQSQYFSHEEAESIYMSAMHGSARSPSVARRMPGQWHETEESVISVTDKPQSISISHSAQPGAGVAPQASSSVRLTNITGSDTAIDEGLRASKIESASSSAIVESPESNDKVRKKILALSEIGIRFSQDHTDQIPAKMEDSDIHAPGNRSTNHRRRMPGSFSRYAESSSSLHQGDMGFADSPCEKDFQASGSASNMIEIDIGDLTLHADVGVCKLITQLSRRLLPVMVQDSATQSRKSAKPGLDASTSRRTTDASFSLHHATIAFVNMLKPVSALSTDEAGSSETSTGGDMEPLLQLILSDISLQLPRLEDMPQARLEVGKIWLGLLGSDVLSFSQERALRTSINDVSKVRNKDCIIDYARRGGGSEIHIWAQPLHARLDMHKVDSTLESIGGLSGLVELGSSMMSDSTVIGRARPMQLPPRSVRFETPTKTGYSFDELETTDLRINVRVGGTSLKLIGESCSVALQSGSITAVSRKSGVRIDMGEIRAEGPLYEGGPESTSLLATVHKTRLTYLFVPEETDLTRLIKLLTPSNDRFEEEDDFLVDTLLKQRKKGAVLRAQVSRIELRCDDMQAVERLQSLTHELSKLSAVTKYLPEETRPGLLTLGSVDTVSVTVKTDSALGDLSLTLASTEVAQVSAPGLIACAVGKVIVQWGEARGLVSPLAPSTAAGQQPMFMARMIEDEMEPVVKIKLWNTCVDYNVPFVEAINQFSATKTPASSTIHLSDSVASTECMKTPARDSKQKPSNVDSRPTRIDLAFRDCAIGLRPRDSPSKALFMLNNATVTGALPDAVGLTVNFDFHKAELLLIDDVSKLDVEHSASRRSSFSTATTPMSRDLCRQGYVNVSSISAANIALNIKDDTTVSGSNPYVEVKFSNQLFVLETCADSTQTLIDTLAGLAPPSPPSTGTKYRTEIAPVEDLMASCLGDVYTVPSKLEDDVIDEELFTAEEGDGYSLEDPEDDIEFESFDDSSTTGHDLRSDPGDDELEESIYGGLGLSELADLEDPALTTMKNPYGAIAASPAQMHESILGSLSLAQLPAQIHGKAKRFDSRRNRYIPVNKTETAKCPVKVHVEDMHIIWNMYDGYDWDRTREAITQAVQDVEARAEEKRKSRKAAFDKEEDDESVIGDCLFNSIYIGVPTQGDPKDLAGQISHDIDDLISDTASRTASQAPSLTSTSTSRPSSSQRPRTPGRRLKLDRSKRHKIAIELKGVSADFFTFPPGGETQSSTDVQIRDFEIFDHVPTSTWKKFLTYMYDAGPREDKKPMVHLEICDVRPVPELTATELVVRVTLLPLRLHVDQDALDFITRFFAFKDSDKPASSTPTDQPFLQRVEIPSIPVKMDYKPHKIDYAALRSGRTKEFMNFVILDGSDFILKHVCLYGVSGLEKLHEMLEDIWMADVKSPQQLPGVLSGLNGVRTLVNMGTGMRDLVQIPIREYKKDGRVVRSISKGALAFGRTTGGELTRFGAKLAVGATRALQGAEGVFLELNPRQDAGWEETDLEPEEKRAFSHYANQPVGILQGLKGAARSLERDLLVTRDVVIAISGEIRESGSVEGAARAVVRNAPTLILRPMIGASKAIGQTMMGATNTVDPANRRRMEDVSFDVCGLAFSIANNCTEI